MRAHHRAAWSLKVLTSSLRPFVLPSYYLVTNAGRRKEDLEHITREVEKFNKKHGTNVKHEVMENRGLIALQGERVYMPTSLVQGDTSDQPNRPGRGWSKACAMVKHSSADHQTQSTLPVLVLLACCKIGPKSANVLQKHLPASVNLDKLYFGHSIFTTFGPNKVNVHIARGGYTGEDGFEISVPGEESISVTKLLLGDANQVDTETGQPLATLVGLAARDSLRLEAGMCLYGHDLSEDVGPLEGGLTWVIGESAGFVRGILPHVNLKEKSLLNQTTLKPSECTLPPFVSPSYTISCFSGESRRADGTFIGAKPVLDAMASKARTQRRVGFLIEPGMVAREGSPIFVPGQSEQIGTITSGIPSPTLKQNIGMGYVQFGHHKIGTELAVKLCGKERKAKVTRMPFVKNNYHREPKE